MSAHPDHEDALFALEVELLLEGIFRRYHHDFRGYARSSLERRLRHAVQRFGVTSVSALQERVLREPAIFDALFSYLTVSVSDMFRDAEFFRVLRRDVMPRLATFPSIKAWVAGCATGEEVYSLAIVLHEAGLLARTTIYATDVDGAALGSAASGVFPLERAAQYSQAYLNAGGTGSLSDYFSVGEDAILFDRALRRDIVFADHSLATDGVFAEVQLVTCRNVLIYFDQPLQERAVGLFRDALCKGGVLGLGSKETLRFSPLAPYFTELDPETRLYTRR